MNIVAFILLFDILLVYFMLSVMIKRLKIFINEQKEHIESLKNEIQDLDNKNTLLYVSNFISLMLLNSSRNNYEQFTQCYHTLFFMGVSKDILDNTDKLADFYTDCITNKMIVKKGEKAFKYKFEKKNEN